MRHLCVIFCLLAMLSAFPQLPPEKVSGLPTNELYDLHVDKKGYLWIAHSLGISRYDGLYFTTYSHPAQINLRTTDIVEDPQGRIWFHNFSGQVFFIEQGKVTLLAAYDFKNENQNPKMVLCGDELLITSYKGLFVCNTVSLSARFLPFAQTSPTTQVSVAVLGERAIVYNNLDWYSYDKGRLQKMVVESTFPVPAENFVSLQPASYNDTIFLTANPSGVLYKLKAEKNHLRFLAKKEYHDFINAVSVDATAWVHTRNQSSNLAAGVLLNGADLTDVVRGKEGSTWYSSRRNGLMVSYRPSLWQQFRFKIEKDDYIRSLNANAGYFFAGTQRGNLYHFETDSAKEDWKLELFNGLGSIDFIRYINNHLFVVGSSTDTYIVDAVKKRIVATLPIRAILDVDFDGSSLYVATAIGLYVVPYLEQPADKTAWLQQKQKQFPFLNWDKADTEAFLLFPQRTSSVRYDSLRNFVYAATKNGLIEVTHGGAHPYLINGKEVFATAVAFKQNRLYVSTINNGLWIIEGKKAQHFTTANELSSNSIIRIKLTEDHLWLFETNGIQVMDIYANRILPNLDLPKLEGANVLDIAEKGNFGYLATTRGIFKVPLHVTVDKSFSGSFLDYVIINSSDTLFHPAASLPYHQNDIQFRFSSPSFYDPENVTFHCRLKGAEEDWRLMPAGERTIHYAALTPGDYEFELYAVGSNGIQQANTIRFPFTINKPWWRTAWFLVLLNLVLVAAIYLIIQNRVRQKLRLELMRRNISHDLHDDIGATLSSVNLYVDLARTEKQNAAYLQHIKDNVNYAINHLDDLVWNINPKNDTTEQFIQRMKDYAIPLLKAARAHCHFEYNARLLQQGLDLQTKRHLYLLFKEMVNNVAKHARCQNCTIRLSYHHGQLLLSVTDDGRGFDPAKTPTSRNGLSSMQERARKLNGEIEIRSMPGEGSRVAVTIPA